MDKHKKTVMVILGAGGHTKQILNLVNSIGYRYNYEYVIGKDDHISETKIKIHGRIFKIYNPRNMKDYSKIIVTFKLLKTTIQSIKILIKSKAEAIICAGPGLGIPISILGRLLFRKKLVFIESWSRVYSKSLTGKILYPIANITFVQWPEQKQKNYARAIFAGRLG